MPSHETCTMVAATTKRTIGKWIEELVALSPQGPVAQQQPTAASGHFFLQRGFACMHQSARYPSCVLNSQGSWREAVRFKRRPGGPGCRVQIGYSSETDFDAAGFFSQETHTHFIDNVFACRP